MHPADRVKMENEMTAAAVAGCLAHAARQRGGVLIGTAAELHKLGSGELWPRSAMELDRVQLPDLARRAGHAGCTVRPVGGRARGVWHVQAAALAQAAPKPPVRPVAAVPAPAAQARPVAALPPLPAAAAPAAAVSRAEYDRVRALAIDERLRRHREQHDRATQAKRAKEHAENLTFLAAAKGRAAA
jgi:hypothetical protein